jgi:3'(2'), 5'-bisphosphate nucleotidase
MSTSGFTLDANARESVLEIARRAGAAILAVYARDFDVEAKADRSPLTEADLAAHALIRDGLAALAPDLPLLSEESAPEDLSERRSWQRYWLVDPLDGTREFVKRNGEFTVNIALVENGRSVFGVVYAPVLDALYWAQRGQGSWLRPAEGEDIQIGVQRPSPRPLRVAVSRSHLDPKSAAMIQHLQQPLQVPLGSSLKFCRLAEGQVDLYPRFGPTGEWDTAAGQCVLEEAGGAVLDLDGQALRYNQRDSLINPDFIALGDVELPWREWL